MSQVSYGTITITDTTDLTTYIRYAKKSPLTVASDFQETPTTDTHFIAVLSIPSSNTIPAWNSTDWKWSEFIGTDGLSVKSTRILYYLKTNSTNVPQVDENISIVSTDIQNAWTSKNPTYVANGTYWTCLEVTLSDNTTKSWSVPAEDLGLTQAAKDAAETKSIAQHANEDAQGALGIARAMQQNFWWWGEDHTVDSSFTLPAGAYTSDIKVDTFKANPTGGYLVTRSDGIYLNNGRYVLMGLTGNALKFYRPGTTQLLSGTETVDAELTSNGLVLSKGGIESDNSGNGYVYLSTEDKTGITINGHNPETNDPKWRAIIGSKFGVDAEGNLYAAGAHIDGDIVAQSLTIGSGANAYSGIAAINISGYSIEIEVVDIAGSTNTKKLIPHLYHNGMNADSEVTDVTKFLWYIDNNMSVPGAAGLSPDGYIIGEYGHTYKVIYDFGDGVVGSGSAIQTRTVDPQKYITRIDANGITIHPETQNGNSSIRLDGTGLTIYDSNGAYLAKYGSTITLGNAENINNNFNIKITNTVNTEDIIGNRGPGILLRKGTTVVNEITENGMKIYGLYVSPGSQVYNFGQLANFGGETKIGATNYTKINENEVGFYRNNNICLGKIDFTETIKNDCIYSFNHMWEDETQLTDTYTESIESYDGLGVTRVKGNFQYMTSSTNVLEEEEFDFDITQSSINTYTISDWFTMDIGILSESWVAEGSLIQEVGYNATTDNTFSYFKINFIIYYDTYSEGPRYIFGKDVNSIGQYSFAMGNNTIAREDCQLTIGKFNIPTDDALFVIGNGVNDNNRSNLMTISDSNICIGKGVETQYNNQFICGRYNEDYENILFAVGNGFNDTHRHNILSAHDVIGHDTDYITDTIEITVPVQTSYISLSNHPLTIEQILVNGINKTNDFSISTANDTILYPNIQLTIGDIVKVTYTIIQRYQIVNINDTYIGTLPGQTGNFITITEEHDFNSSWTFTIPNTIYPSSIFYLLTATGAGGTPRVTEELVQGVAKSIEYYGYTITYNGAYTLSYIYDEDEMHLVTSRRFKGVQYSTEPTISSENGIWMPFGALDDPQLYTIIQRFNWLDDVTKDIILT